MKQLCLIAGIAALAALPVSAQVAGPALANVDDDRVRALEIAEAVRQSDADRQAKTREANDLIAQQSMADSARKMADYTLLQIIIGALGAAFVCGTLIQTQRSMNSSAKSLDQNAELLTMTRAHAEMQLRAYPALESVIIEELTTEPKLVLTYKNFGQTPAVYFKPRLSIELVRSDASQLAWREIPDEREVDSKTSLVPNAVAQSFVVLQPPLTVEDIAEIEANRALLVARAQVEFKDIFGNVTQRRHTWAFYGPEAKTRFGVLGGSSETLLRREDD